MIRSRPRPPPRGPGRSSDETRPAISSNSAHAAFSSLILRSNVRVVEGRPVHARRRERDAPEVGRAGAHIALDDRDIGLPRQLRPEPSALRNGCVAREIAAQLRDCLVLAPAIPFEARPIGGKGDPALALRRLLDQHPQVRTHDAFRRRRTGMSRSVLDRYLAYSGASISIRFQASARSAPDNVSASISTTRPPPNSTVACGSLARL